MLGGESRLDGLLLGPLAGRDVALDRLGHLVEGARHLLELGDRADVRPLRVVAGRDPARDGDQLLERAQRGSAQPHHRRPADERQDREDRDLRHRQAADVGTRLLNVAQRAALARAR